MTTGATADSTEPLGQPAGDTASFAPCYGDQLECGAVEVPIDTTDPSLGTLDIAVAIHPAAKPDERIGILMINPGGPGGSGIEFAIAASHGIFPPEIVDRFDIVGFDPRGVGASEPEFTCGDDAEWVERLKEAGTIEVGDEADYALAEEAVDACVAEMGPAATRLGTDFVVRDMDFIRAALGEDQINYYGASYGSTIGPWYATRFPDRVRAMVVDGADNPDDDYSTPEAATESYLEESVVIEQKLREALEACTDASCPIYNDGDPVGFFLDHVDDLTLVDDEFDGYPGAGVFGVVSTLYDEDDWPDLWQGMADLADGDPTLLAQSAEIQFQGSYGANFTPHVNCLDSWAFTPDRTPDEILGVEEEITPAVEKELPLLTAMEAEGSADFCPFFQSELPQTEPIDLTGGAVPVVIVANVQDPFTALGESIEMFDGLDNGYLIEADYPAHVVYPNNSCVVDLVNRTLISGTPPEERTVECPTSDNDPENVEYGAVTNTGILALLCDAVLPTDADPAAANRACAAVVTRGDDEFDGVDLEAALDEPDVTVIQQVVGLIGEEFGKEGLEPNLS